ncbi:hypothetical protein FisN_7Hh389 [Fistulifera solaris]|uniref:Uncharacterized protein n=1 Tax=Fistulifera solaris TaxID=1519565 RepID=A0A1Z5KRS8_FISSO|nr:hypothetical protein FisN_7Hh389 [Fistulifera solaris]|eukprot:GAX29020.1 hypothetical protein FisN_7Hh389 [Fistulifera solaris]
MLIPPQEIRWDGRCSSTTNSSPQEQFLESQKLQLEDWKADLTMNSYDTIELLKQSLKQLNYLTQQQAQQEQATCLQGVDDEEAKETLESNTRSSLLKLIEEYDQPRSVLLNGRSKTLSRRNSFSSQVSTSSNKSVRFGNVSIVTAQELAQLSVTTVDAYERESSARKHLKKKPDKTDALEEYVKMAQSTRRRKTMERTHSTSTLSNSTDTKARRRSLFRKKDDSSSVRSTQSAVSLNDSVASSSRSHQNAKQQNRPSSHHGNDNHSVGSSTGSRTTSPRGSKQKNSGPPNITKGFFVTKLFTKPFQRRKGKHTTTCSQPTSNPTETSNNQDHVDIFEVTMDDNITETSSNDDSAAIVMKDIRYQRQQRRRTPQKASVPEQPLRRGVRRSNSGASSVASSRSLVQRAARLLMRRPSSANHSDVGSVASSISSSAASVVQGNAVHPSIVILNEVTDETLDDDDSSDTPPMNEDTAKLQHDIETLKKRLMGLVVEHMEESEKQKQLKLQRAVPTTAS